MREETLVLNSGSCLGVFSLETGGGKGEMLLSLHCRLMIIHYVESLRSGSVFPRCSGVGDSAQVLSFLPRAAGSVTDVAASVLELTEPIWSCFPAHPLLLFLLIPLSFQICYRNTLYGYRFPPLCVEHAAARVVYRLCPLLVSGEMNTPILGRYHPKWCQKSGLVYIGREAGLFSNIPS